MVNYRHKKNCQIEKLVNSYPNVVTMAFRRSVELERLSSYLEYLKGDIVDIGCGDGLFASLLFRSVQNVTGYDIDKQTIQRASNSGIYRAVFVADARSTPLSLIAELSAKDKHLCNKFGGGSGLLILAQKHTPRSR